MSVARPSPTHRAASILAVLGALAVAGCQRDATDSGGDSAASSEGLRLVMLVVDGARIEETFADESCHGEGWSDAYGGPTAEIMPTVRDELLPQGAVVRPGFVIGDTSTQPAHSDFLTGYRTPSGPLVLGDGGGFFRPQVPTLFEHAREQWGSEAEQVVLTHNTIHMIPFGYSIAPGYGEELRAANRFHTDDGQVVDADTIADREDASDLQPSTDDTVLIDDVRTLLADGARVVLANLHDVDRSGHERPEIHSKSVQALDEPIAELWSWIQSPDSGVADRTLVAVFSDHGRHRFVDDEYPWESHHCACTGCREVPILLLGPGIRAGAEASVVWTLEASGSPSPRWRASRSPTAPGW